MPIQYTISDDVFARFPDYCRGVVIATGVRNGSSPEELVNQLRAAEDALAAQLSAETLLTHPRMDAWRAAYRVAGIKPADFRPSVEALARRVLKGDRLPTISSLVDIGTLVSIQHLLPVGAHAIDHVTQNIALRIANGNELFEPLGAEGVEHPQLGEIIFVEGNTVLTRRWTWRQAKHTLVTSDTQAVEINVDGLPPVTVAEVEQVCQEVAALVKAYCGGQSRYAILSRESPSMLLK